MTMMLILCYSTEATATPISALEYSQDDHLASQSGTTTDCCSFYGPGKGIGDVLTADLLNGGQFRVQDGKLGHSDDWHCTQILSDNESSVPYTIPKFMEMASLTTGPCVSETELPASLGSPIASGVEQSSLFLPTVSLVRLGTD